MLVRQLQDQHYQQYIQQLAVDQRLANSNLKDNEQSENENENVKVKEETVKDCNRNDTDVVAVMDNK